MEMLAPLHMECLSVGCTHLATAHRYSQQCIGSIIGLIGCLYNPKGTVKMEVSIS